MPKDTSKSVVINTDMGNIDLDDLMDKSLVAKGTVKAYQLPRSTSKEVAVYSNGDSIGSIYSYIINAGKIWLQIYGKDNIPFYVQLSSPLNMGTLKAQGLKTIEEKKVEKDNKENPQTFMDKLQTGILKFGKTIMIVIIITVVIFVVIKFYKIYNAK